MLANPLQCLWARESLRMRFYPLISIVLLGCLAMGCKPVTLTTPADKSSTPDQMDCHSAWDELLQVRTNLNTCETDSDCQYLKRDDSGVLVLVAREDVMDINHACRDLAPTFLNGASFTTDKDALNAALEDVATACGPGITPGCIQTYSSGNKPVCSQNQCINPLMVVN